MNFPFLNDTCQNRKGYAHGNSINKLKKETEPLGRKSVKHKIRQTNTNKKGMTILAWLITTASLALFLNFNIELHTYNEHEKN
jgi:hypothetical protein